MKCTICQHPKRQEIDQALAAGSATLNALSQEHGLSTSSLHRHKAHLQAKMTRAKKQLQNNLFQSFYFWLTEALEMTMETARAAQAEANFKLLLQSISQGTRLINIMLKQDFPLEDRMVYAILTSPQWATQSGLLPHDPNIMVKIRQSLAGVLSTPCPDGPPPSAPSASPVELKLEAIQTVPSTPANLQLKTKNRKLQTENRLSKREKTGNFPAYDCYVFDKEEEYRMLELEKKIAHLDLDAILRGLPPAAASAKEEAIFEHLYNCESIPEGKSLAEYLHEQSLLETPTAN